MPITVSSSSVASEAPRFFVTVTIAMGVYPTGGEALDYATYLPAGAVLAGMLPWCNGTYEAFYDATNKKVMMRTAADGVEVAGSTDLAALTAVPLVFVAL